MSQIVNSILNSDFISLELIFPNVVSDFEGVEVYSRKSLIGTSQEINIIVIFYFYICILDFLFKISCY